MLRQYFITYFSLNLFLLNISYSNTLGELKICALRVSFPIDDDLSTSGDGGFLMSSEGIDCGTITNGQFTHVVATVTSSNVMKLYQDGVLVGTDSSGVTALVMT